MTIKKKIENEDTDSKRKREMFISKGGSVSADTKEKPRTKNVLISIPTQILESLDAHLKERPWMNRVAWIVEAIHEKLSKDYNSYL